MISLLPLTLVATLGGSSLGPIRPGSLGTLCADGTALLGGGTCPTAGAPGPAPLAGAVAGFHASRQIRRRIRRSK